MQFQSFAANDLDLVLRQQWVIDPANLH